MFVLGSVTAAPFDFYWRWTAKNSTLNFWTLSVNWRFSLFWQKY